MFVSFFVVENLAIYVFLRAALIDTNVRTVSPGQRCIAMTRGWTTGILEDAEKSEYPETAATKKKQYVEKVKFSTIAMKHRRVCWSGLWKEKRKLQCSHEWTIVSSSYSRCMLANANFLKSIKAGALRKSRRGVLFM